MERELQNEGVSQKEIERIITSLLGKECNGVRTMGLVDNDDDESFIASYNILKLKLPERFVQWLETTKGRYRSLPDTMKRCMLRPIRTSAELVRGIRGLGEYRLISKKKHLQVSDSEWIRMSEKQRKSKIISSFSACNRSLKHKHVTSNIH